jgi:hypothetical protein
MRRIALSIGIGLLVGLAIGLTLGWAVLPVEYVDSSMKDLASRYKDEYTVMIAAGYQLDHDPNAAIERLKPIVSSENVNIPVYVRDVTERYISGKGTGREADIRSLVELSCALGYCTELMQSFRLPPSLPTALPTPGS